MKTLRSFLATGCVTLFLIFQSISARATVDCLVSKSHGQGYTSSISLVTDNGDGTHTITLYITQEGPSSCKKLTRYSVEAQPGTYSNISVIPISGNMQYSGITSGPSLPGDPFTGFRINNITGIGGGTPGSFAIRYTLSGPLQNQRVKAKVKYANQIQSFLASDFQSVQDCAYPPPVVTSDILPYYEPLPEGKSYEIIGSELTSLHNLFEQSGSYESNDIFQIEETNVLILILTQPGQYQNTMDLLTSPAYGLSYVSGNPANRLISGLFPIENLLSLNTLPNLLISASPINTPINNAGLVDSQGDKSLRSDISRNLFHINGAGIKVGVISDSYNTILGDPAGDDIIKGDLPGPLNPDFQNPVDLLLDYPFGVRTDEGRAMLQIVHDVAPGADLAFRTGFLGPVDFAHGIHALHDAGCDVIVDDVTYISELFFRDGVVAQAVDSVSMEGTTYFSAAGNFGSRSWQGNFTPSAAPNGISGDANNFAADQGGTDIFQNVTLYQGKYTLVLQWDDGSPGNTTNSDYDIYLTNENGITLFGFNRINTDGFPIEVLPFTVATDSTQSNIMIIRTSGTSPAKLKYIVYRGDLKVNEYDSPNASTITGQANASSAIAVGAVLYSNTPAYNGGAPTIASFSSRGGTPVNGVIRTKPDLCAPNGGNTTVDLGGVNIDGDVFPNFFGTSAAAPHAAAVAALVLQARQKYYGDTLSPTMLRGILESTAYDMGSPGTDLESGSGFILADSALLNLANPSPHLENLTYDTTLTPGVDDIWLTIHGEYLKDGAEVWFNGAPLETESVIHGDTAISALISAYDDLYPAIQVYNQPKEGTNGLDGGLSNPLYFTTKETIIINVDSKEKKYAELMPEFTAQYSVMSLTDSLSLQSSHLTSDEKHRIQSIDLTSIANNLSNVGLWTIQTDASDPLSPNSTSTATDSLDISLLQRFNIVVNNGILTIDPLDLLITPRDTSFVYNDSIVDFSFNYLFNNDSTGSILIGESDSLALLSAIKEEHKTPRETILVRGTALVNNAGEELLNGTVLTNKAVVVSETHYVTRGTALVNGELLDPMAFYNAAMFTNSVAPSPPIYVRGTALVNSYQLVRGTALVNTLDSSGNIINTTALTNSDALVNSSGNFNSTTINANSNSETIVILGEDDIAIISGDSVGSVNVRSINLITGNTVGTHLTVPGAFFSNNFNISYGVGSFEVLPDTVRFSIDPESLVQTYDGTGKTISVTSTPENPGYIITYNGDTIPPVNAGQYAVIVTPSDSNYVGSTEAILTINQAEATVTINPASLDQVFDGSPKEITASTLPEGLTTDITYNGNSEAPVNAGSYPVNASVNDPNYFGSADGILVISPAVAEIMIDPSSLIQIFDNTVKSPVITTIPEGLNIQITYENDAQPVNQGAYDFIAEIIESNYTGSSAGTLNIIPAGVDFSINIESLTQTYDGTPKSITLSSVPEGIGYSVTYNGDVNPPVNAGEYAVEVHSTNSDYSGSAEAVLTINKAQANVTIDPVSLTQIYDGLPKAISVSTLPEGLALEISYNGESLPPVNAGNYPVTATVNNPNYFGTANATLVINPAEAQIIFDPETLTQIYDNTVKTPGVSTIPEGLNVNLIYQNDVLPINPGSYQIDAEIDDQNYTGYGSTTLVIIPATAVITIDTESLSQMYNGLPKSVSVSVDPEGLPLIITYDGSVQLPVNAGSYAVNVSIDSPLYTVSEDATLVIQPVVATVSTGNYVINAGNPAPDFEAEFSGFIGDDDSSVVTSLSFELSPYYNGHAGNYEIIPSATATNYIFESVSGQLYVNPFGFGTLPVIPLFICREELTKPDSSGFNYVAHFSYINFNGSDVYVPKGINNRLTGAAHNEATLPEVFTPGWMFFDIHYNGTPMTWQISTNGFFNMPMSLYASANGFSCGGAFAFKSMDDHESANATQATGIAYPNPSSGKVYIQFAKNKDAITQIEVYDYLGRKCAVPSQNLSDQSLEIDLTGFSEGMYIIRISRQEKVESYNVIIQ